jgi:hypothetical protein
MTPLVGVLPREGELPIREAVEIVLGAANKIGGPTILSKRILQLVEGFGPAAAPLSIG